MRYLGCHLSSSGGYLAMVRTAQKIGANTFAFFTRNPRGSRAKAENPLDAAAAVAEMKESGFGRLVAHGSYTMNLCTKDPEARSFAVDILCDDLRRMEAIPDNYYNFHPGSHVGQGADVGISQIVDALQKAMKPEYPVTVLLESMAGKGSEIGCTFQQLHDIIEGVGSDHLGVCLDTCHIWDGGYDIVHDLDGVLDEFDRVVGLDRLKALHLNDSKNPRSSHKDRHECIGDGHLGLPTFHHIINHPALSGLPMILETPNELPGYAKEIAMLRDMEQA